MPLDEPSWWYSGRQSGIAACLAPVSLLYGWAAQRRYVSGSPYRSRLPVICAGNLTAGGTGKTPLVLHLCDLLRRMGREPIALTRGYGGQHAGPHQVLDTDTADDVGDEALLLARAAPTIVSRDRGQGACAAELLQDDAVLVMDDGLQNPSLAKDLSIVVVDGSRGIGNGRVIPAGPLRAPLDFQLGLADAIVVNGTSATADSVSSWLQQRFAGPVLRSSTVPADDAGWLRGERIVAWAGIGSPQRFFGLLQSLSADVVECIAFRDHQRLSEADAERLLTLGDAQGAKLISTTKDLARLRGATGKLDALAAATTALEIKLAFSAEDARRLQALVAATLARHMDETKQIKT